MFVARLSDMTAMVTTNDMIMLSTADVGLTAGIDKLMELASLPGITRVSPVTLRLMFNTDARQASAPQAAPANDAVEVAAVAGDPSKGKRVFKKCRACHALDEGKNKSGPSLHGLFGATAGQVAGFGYSNAISESGIVWNAETLAEFVANPKKAIPGNKMSFRGLKKADDIENLIAYLAEETGA